MTEPDVIYAEVERLRGQRNALGYALLQVVRVVEGCDALGAIPLGDRRVLHEALELLGDLGFLSARPPRALRAV